MGEALGGRGKRRRNIAQKHGGAKDGLGVKLSKRKHEANANREQERAAEAKRIRLLEAEDSRPTGRGCRNAPEALPDQPMP